jgi:hypothetical protein
VLTSFSYGVDIKTNRLAAQAKSRYVSFKEMIKKFISTKNLLFSVPQL